MTVEAAIALSALVLTVVLCVGAVAALVQHLRCLDAAREAARLAARGDPHAVDTARRVAPEGAAVVIRTEGRHTVAVVTIHAPLLPMLDISAEAVAETDDE